MSGDLLQTKLYVPRVRPPCVPRPHLIQKLNQGLQTGGKLTLISAPAGFGKTTLVSEWIAGGKRPFAWLSLDERDSDLTRFLTYLMAALQTLRPSLGKKALGMFELPEPPPTETVLTTLINEIAAVPEEFALVLDDYHILDAAPIDQALTFLLKHLPPQMYLVITTREDPPLPLSRLRVRGLLTELRAADLRFTVEETAVSVAHKDVILQAMIQNIDLPAGQLHAFCQRHRIRQLSLFGSVLRDDFTPESDVDILVEFESGVEETLTLMDLAGMQIELANILQREVDLVLRDGLKPLLKEEILAHSEVVYAV